MANLGFVGLGVMGSRVVDGARAARFLDDVARLIEEPWELLA